MWRCCVRKGVCKYLKKMKNYIPTKSWQFFCWISDNYRSQAVYNERATKFKLIMNPRQTLADVWRLFDDILC